MPSTAAAMKQTEQLAPPPAAPPPRKLPEVGPLHIKINSAGFAWRDILVRLPEGAIQDDLRTPSIWKKAQGDAQTALVKLDHLFILAFDESWFARAVVTHATSTEAHLSIEKVGSFKE